MNATTILLFIAGLALLIIGAEVLVRGASRLASAVGIPPLVIGLTVVAFGTSSPELAVSVQASWTGRPDVAVGNVVGSNIFNVLFILGLAAAIVPLVVAQQLVRWEVPLLIGVSVLFWLLASDGLLGRVDGTVLFAGIVAYTVFAIRQSRRETAAIRAEYAQEIGGTTEPPGRLPVQVVLILVGLALLVVGSHWLVEGATAVARAAGLSELVVGLTIVAAGTSLPEVTTSVLASIRGERDIAVGNAIGSNLFNLLCVLGLSALVAPAGIPVAAATLGFDIPVMVAVAVACLPIFFTGYLIARWEGLLFLGYYVAYTAYLIAAAKEHDALPIFSTVMLWFVVPLTVITLIVLVARAWRLRGRP
jgi:cation:H+ antiporter